MKHLSSNKTVVSYNIILQNISVAFTRIFCSIILEIIVKSIIKSHSYHEVFVIHGTTQAYILIMRYVDEKFSKLREEQLP